jgi:hypothetical protein
MRYGLNKVGFSEADSGVDVQRIILRRLARRGGGDTQRRRMG